MAIEHKDIPEAELHEIKGASTASVGQVPVSNGAGSTTFQHNGISTHGEMTITNNTTAKAVTAATDPTLKTDSDYSKITVGWAGTHSAGIVFNVDELIVPVDGHYLLYFWGDIKVPLNNNFIGVKFAVNDTTPYSLQRVISQSVTTNDYKNIAANGYQALSAGDTISLYIAASKTDNLVIEEAGLVLLLIHEV